MSENENESVLRYIDRLKEVISYPPTLWAIRREEAKYRSEVAEGLRQEALALRVGQVHCSDDESHHDPDMLPCQRCGAAL